MARKHRQTSSDIVKRAVAKHKLHCKMEEFLAFEIVGGEDEPRVQVAVAETGLLDRESLRALAEVLDSAADRASAMEVEIIRASFEKDAKDA